MLNRDLLVKAYVDISQWWPRDESGEMKSVYSVFKLIENTENHVTRHTLTNAREGKLQNADIDNLVKLSRICSVLSGEELTVNDIIRIKE